MTFIFFTVVSCRVRTPERKTEIGVGSLEWLISESRYQDTQLPRLKCVQEALEGATSVLHGLEFGEFQFLSSFCTTLSFIISRSLPKCTSLSSPTTLSVASSHTLLGGLFESILSPLLLHVLSPLLLLSQIQAHRGLPLSLLQPPLCLCSTPVSLLSMSLSNPYLMDSLSDWKQHIIPRFLPSPHKRLNHIQKLNLQRSVLKSICL